MLMVAAYFPSYFGCPPQDISVAFFQIQNTLMYHMYKAK